MLPQTSPQEPTCVVTSTNLRTQSKCATPLHRRSVIFDLERNQTQLIPMADEYTDEEWCSMFYDQVEYQLMKSEIHQTVKKMKLGSPEDDENCYRGLEFKCELVARRRIRNRKIAQSVVFDEQDRQDEVGEWSSDDIAQVYGAISQQCQSEAFRRGIRDSEIAMTALAEVVKAYGHSLVDAMGISLGMANKNKSNPKTMPATRARRNVVPVLHSPTKAR